MTLERARDELRKLLERARDELRKHGPKLMTNAEFYIQSQADALRDVWFVVGKGQNKFFCCMGSEVTASQWRTWSIAAKSDRGCQQTCGCKWSAEQVR